MPGSISQANRTAASQITLDKLACENRGIAPVTAEVPGEGEQVVVGVDVDQHRLMPRVEQELALAFRMRTGMIRDGLVVLVPWAAGLRRLGEVFQCGAEGVGFVGDDPVGDGHQFGQREPGGRSYGHTSMIGDRRRWSDLRRLCRRCGDRRA